LWYRRTGLFNNESTFNSHLLCQLKPITPKKKISKSNFHLACLHDQTKSGFFGGPVFIQNNLKILLKALIGWKKPTFQKAAFVMIMQTG